ncbi:MAG: hypothetical protein HY799_11935 [Nitrosomonadales bacterium]|nr:hypothetical protein [Nitrosomonadales bacterium]
MTDHMNTAPKAIPSSIDEIDTELSADVGSEYDFSNHILDKQTQPLLESALLQWTATRWRNKNIKAIASSHSRTEEEASQYLNRLANSAPGTLLSMLPSGKVEGVTPRVSSKFKSQVISNQDKWPGLALSDWMMLMCIDARPKDFPHQLYRNSEHREVVGWDDYDFVVKGLMKSVADGGKLYKLSDTVSTIFYELFKNTHDHARADIDGRIIGDSIRSIYARYYPANKLARPPLAKSTDAKERVSPVEWYIQTILKNQSLDTSGFLELSVFDMGPGLAAKWLSKTELNCGAKEQYEAVLSCLAKGSSSTQRNGRGFGLWNVLQALRKEKGFIRIRTNGVHAYRQYAMLNDLGMEESSSGGKTIKEILYDWKRVHVTTPSDYPPAEGTLISVLLPLEGA